MNKKCFHDSSDYNWFTSRPVPAMTVAVSSVVHAIMLCKVRCLSGRRGRIFLNGN